jgi:hypothetical protein
MAQHVIESYPSAEVASTGVAFAGGPAHAVYIVATCSSGLTLTLVSGATVVLGNAVIGTTIPIRCTTATFGAGGVAALRIDES